MVGSVADDVCGLNGIAVGVAASEDAAYVVGIDGNGVFHVALVVAEFQEVEGDAQFVPCVGRKVEPGIVKDVFVVGKCFVVGFYGVARSQSECLTVFVGALNAHLVGTYARGIYLHPLNVAFGEERGVQQYLNAAGVEEVVAGADVSALT